MFDSWPGGSWEATAKFFGGVAVVYLAAIWVALVFWVYRDIRQRSRDPVLQTVAVVIVLLFFLPGLGVYLIVRPRYTLTEIYERSLEEEALLQELEDQKACPSCKRRIHDDYLICPSCRTRLKEPCRQCAKPLSYAWVACPFCGQEKPPRENPPPRPVRPAASRFAPEEAAAPAPSRQRTAPAQPARPLPSAPVSPQPSPRPKRDPFGPRTASQDDGPVIGE